jgi:hypothetical protein
MTDGVTDASWYDEEWNQAANVMKGKMRSVFGPWIVVNENT